MEGGAIIPPSSSSMALSLISSPNLSRSISVFFFLCECVFVFWLLLCILGEDEDLKKRRDKRVTSEWRKRKENIFDGNGGRNRWMRKKGLEIFFFFFCLLEWDTWRWKFTLKKLQLF
ncbi:hypothetical protein ACJW30_10G153300 [Castanea mollissima]